MYVNPSTSFEATAKFPTGLTGSLGVRITDNIGGTTTARATAGVAEYPAGSGIYEVTLTSPGAAGQYSLVWDDADGHFAHEDLVVTRDSVTEIVIGTGNLYVTRADLKTILDIQTGESYANESLDLACEAASRVIDAYKGTRYYPTTEVRFYTNTDQIAAALAIDDFVSLSSLKTDDDNDGGYETTLVSATDYLLEPVNNPLEGRPYNTIRLLQRSGRRWPTSEQAIRVAGSFGWSSAPALVHQAAVLLANRYLERTRQAPLGVLVAQANDAISIARLGRIDADAAFLLDQLPAGATQPGAGTLQLG